jgi:hypothetical protein
MHVDRLELPRRVTRRQACLGMLSLAALLLHAAILSELDWSWPQRETPHAAAVLVRMVEPVATEVPMATHETPPPAASPVVAQALPAVVPAAVVRRVVATRAVPAEAPVLLAVAPKPRVEAAPAPAPTQAGAPAASQPAGDELIPHYRTQMPGSVTLRYQVSRGMLHGSGELQWRPQGDQYELKLESKLGGMTLLTQISRGGFDADGIAPLRFTDWRIRRSTVAANFQRDAGKVSFSGSTQELPLEPGVQDRVSWMVQLAAIVAAQPNLRTPGAKVVMHVVGANADASVWAFKCVGNETVETDMGPIDSVKYVREPRGPNDTTAQAWLDSKHHFLPARASLRSGPNDEGFELKLQDVIGNP